MSVEMKDSGIAWLGKIPKHWNRISLKFLCQISTGDKDTVNKIDDGLYPFFVRSPQIERINSYTYDGEAILMAGDGVGAGRVFHYFCGKFDFHQRVYNLHNIQGAKGKFLYYYLSSNFYKLMDAGSAKSTVDSVRLPMLKDFPIVVPAIEEQSRIANFLDKKCAEIDELIALQEQMIAQLNTYKQAVITEIVTKGLDPNVKMKDSGVEWIGEIPELWEVIPLRFLGRTQNGISKGGDYFGEGYPFVNYGDIYKNYFIGSDGATGLAKSSMEDQMNYSVKKGDVFFTRTSETIEEIGFSCACVETIENATFSGFLIRFRPYDNILYPLYSGYYFRSIMHRQYFVKEMNIVTRTSLGQDLLKGLPVIIPPLSEQQSIAQYLDQKCKEIDELISIKKEKIEHLKAYKKSVIYEYVTGKKQVTI